MDMALWTLRNMSLGGMYDHVGHGFHRYSTDRRWFVPHFEKMLYDQALLVMAYTEAYQLTKDDWFKKVACDTLQYVLRDLTSSEGGFYSSEDADSEGEEGKFYTFTYEEVVKALGENGPEPFLEACDIREAGNYKEEASGRYLGRNILHMTDDLETLAVRQDLPRSELSDILSSGFQALYRLREGRVRPALDDKVLLDWNGLMIAALARAYRAFGDESHLTAAMGAVDMIETRMSDPFDGLHHTYREGGSAVKAFLSDLASYAWGLLELYMASHEMRYLKRARQIADEICSEFASPSGDFYLALDNEELLVRGKEHYDGAIPAGNSIATYVLAMLYQITDDEQYRHRAIAALEASMPHALRVPSAHAFLGMAADILRSPPATVVVNDGGDDGLARVMKRAIDSAYLPDAVVIMRRPGAEASCKELPHLKTKGSEKGKGDRSHMRGRSLPPAHDICRGPHRLVGQSLSVRCSDKLEGRRQCAVLSLVVVRTGAYDYHVTVAHAEYIPQLRGEVRPFLVQAEIGRHPELPALNQDGGGAVRSGPHRRVPLLHPDLDSVLMTVHQDRHGLGAERGVRFGEHAHLDREAVEELGALVRYRDPRLLDLNELVVAKVFDDGPHAPFPDAHSLGELFAALAPPIGEGGKGLVDMVISEPVHRPVPG